MPENDHRITKRTFSGMNPEPWNYAGLLSFRLLGPNLKLELESVPALQGRVVTQSASRVPSKLCRQSEAGGLLTRLFIITKLAAFA